MPQLCGEMEQYLRGWQDDLSAAWREGLDDAAPDINAIPQDDTDASLDQNAQIVPCRRDGHGPLYALEGIDPSDVSVVMIGNDPYPDPHRATGRSFEQGDLTDWIESLSEPGRVTPSLLSHVRAAVALLPDATELDLADDLRRREKLRDALNGTVVLPLPQSMFEILTGQGVLWLNRTLTTSVFNTGRRRGGSCWRDYKKQRKWHRALWAPITNAILSSLVDEARTRPIVFALFGDEAKNLLPWIEAQRRCLDAPLENVRLVQSWHPSCRGFFSTGNPLGRINDELILCECDPIDWCGPTAQRTGEDASIHLAAPPALASRRSIAIMDRTVGRYRTTLRQLARL